MASTILAKAVHAARHLPALGLDDIDAEFYDDYSIKPDGAVATSDSGHAYTDVNSGQTGVVQQVHSGIYANTVTAAVPTADYQTVQLARAIRNMGGRFVLWAPTTGVSGSCGLHVWKTPIASSYPTIPDSPCHLPMSQNNYTFGTWNNNQITNYFPTSDPTVNSATVIRHTSTDGNTTSGSPNVSSATAAFTSSDVGATIAGSGIATGTTILSVTDSTHAVMSANATTTATTTSFAIGNASGASGAFISSLTMDGATKYSREVWIDYENGLVTVRLPVADSVSGSRLVMFKAPAITANAGNYFSVEVFQNNSSIDGRGGWSEVWGYS